MNSDPFPLRSGFTYTGVFPDADGMLVFIRESSAHPGYWWLWMFRGDSVTSLKRPMREEGVLAGLEMEGVHPGHGIWRRVAGRAADPASPDELPAELALDRPVPPGMRPAARSTRLRNRKRSRD